MEDFDIIEAGLIDWFEYAQLTFCKKNNKIGQVTNEIETWIFEKCFEGLSHLSLKLVPSKNDVKNLIEGFLDECDIIAFDFKLRLISKSKDNQGVQCIIPVFYVTQENSQETLIRYKRVKRLADIAQTLSPKMLGFKFDSTYIYPLYICTNTIVVDSIKSMYLDKRKQYFEPTIINIEAKAVCNKNVSLLQFLNVDYNWVKNSKLLDFLKFR